MKFIGTEFDPKKMHIYDVRTTGKHPVRLVEGGTYITEDEGEFPVLGDMGWYHLNQREYAYFKSKCREIVLADKTVTKYEIVKHAYDTERVIFSTFSEEQAKRYLVSCEIASEHDGSFTYTYYTIEEKEIR